MFLNVLRQVLGKDYAAQADPKTFLLSRQTDGVRNDLAALQGKRFVAAVETQEGRRLDASLVKAVTGGDSLRVRYLFKEPFEYQPTWKPWLATNDKPVITDTSYAMWRRMRLIPFEVTIPPDRQDKDLEQRLLREAEGILRWAVEGAVAYVQHGLPKVEAVTAATESYRTDSDAIGRFLDECTSPTPNATASKTEVRKRYEEWCEQEGEEPANTTKFGKYLAGKFKADRDRKARYWIGLELKA